MKILLQQIFDVEVKAGKTLRVPKYHIFLILIKNQTKKKPIFTPLLNIYFYFSNINKFFQYWRQWDRIATLNLLYNFEKILSIELISFTINHN